MPSHLIFTKVPNSVIGIIIPSLPVRKQTGSETLTFYRSASSNKLEPNFEPKSDGVQSLLPPSLLGLARNVKPPSH